MDSTGPVSQADIDALESGIDSALGRIENLLALEAYAEDLPIIGDQLAQAQNALQTIAGLKDAIRGALDTVSNLPNLAAMTAAEVQSEIQTRINNALSALGNGFAGVVTAEVNASTGDISLAFDTGRTTSASFTPGDLGMASLGLDMEGTAQAALGYDFNFRVGLDGSGFYLDTSQSNLSFGADVSLGNLTATANLGFLHFTASNIADADPGASADTMSLDFGTSWNTTGLIRDFTGDLLNVSVSGDVDLDLHLAADMGDAALPGISADLHVDWSFNQNLLNGSAPNSFGGATVTFDNVQYDLGTFVDNFITPILDAIDPILGPLEQALRVLNTDLTILPDDWVPILDKNGGLDGGPDGRVTVLDIIESACDIAGKPIDLGPVTQFFAIVEQVVAIADFLRGRDFDASGYDLGAYSVQLQNLQDAANALSSLDLGAGTFTGTGTDLTSFLSGLGGGGFGDVDADGASGGELLAGLFSSPIFSVPIIEDPLNAIRLLLGQNVDLFTLDLPTIELGVGYDTEGNLDPVTIGALPIWPFPLVTAQMNVAFQAVIDLAFGYDTSGLTEFRDSGFTDFGAIFNGFYLDDQRSGDDDVPEIILRAAAEIGLDLNLVVGSVGATGNIAGEVVLDFANSLFGADGRLYYNEITQLGLDFAANPFSLFDVEGRITAGLRFYINTPLGYLVNWNPERLTLVDFSFEQGAAEVEATPPGLGDQFGADLYLNIGDRAGQRDIANQSDVGERIEISAGAGGKIGVSGFGVGQLFPGVDEISTVGRIIADGGAGGDEILLDAGVTVVAELSGQTGSDTLGGGAAADILHGGTEDDWLLGRAGTDVLHGEDGNDYLEGGADGDAIDGGAGDFDTATYINSAAGVTLNFTTGVHGGDAASDTFTGVESFEGSNHSDSMTGAGARDVFFGANGDDSLNGMGGNDVLVGGLGTNTVAGGAGYDITTYYSSRSGVTVTMNGTSGTATAGPAEALILSDTLSGIEQVNGSRNADTMTGGAGNQVFVGEEGADTLAGGAHDDLLLGGAGGDSIDGGTGIDTASYEFANEGVAVSLGETGGSGTGGEAAGDTLQNIEQLFGSSHNDSFTGLGGGQVFFGMTGDDTLAGGGGDDVLEGGAGADGLQGGDGRDMASYFNAASGITLDLVNGTRGGEATGDTLAGIEVLGGSNSSTSGDFIRGADSTATAEEIRGYAGNDSLFGAGGDDLILGGEGTDLIDGEADDDTLQGGAGNDTLRGNAGADVLHGGAGNDSFDGGADAGSERDRVTYFDSTLGILLNLSVNAQTVAGTTLAALTVTLKDGLGAVVETDTIVRNVGANVSTIEDATGSLRNDRMVASELGSVLVGLAGDDGLYGLSGSDVLNGGVGGDVLDGGGGLQDMADYSDDGAGVTVNLTQGVATDGAGFTDAISNIEWARGSDHADTLTGKAGVNRLEGGLGADTLNGLAGNDVMIGGRDDDVYFVDTGNGTNVAGDTVIEQAGEGTDLIKASLNYSIANLAHVEELQLLGSVVSGTGNGGANRMIGNDAANILDGGAGGDTFWGYGGNDIYHFDSLGDTTGIGTAPRSGITGSGEVAGGGTDEIRLATAGLTPVNTAVTYSIDVAWALQIENVVLQDDDRNVSLTGNARNNHLVGNAHWQTLLGGLGNDVLDAGTGRDVVNGGDGRDTLVIDWSGIDYGQTTGLSVAAGGGYDGNFFWGPSIGDGNHYRVEFFGIERFDVTMGSGNDDIRTGDDDDIARGSAGDDILRTGKGADIVIGGDNADGSRGIDTWVADKSAAAKPVIINLVTGATASYSIGLRTGSVTGVEVLGLDAGSERFSTGSGADIIRTMDARYNDHIATNGGNDRVTLAGGRDWVDMGGGTDTLVIDWSDIDYGQTTSIAVDAGGGYEGNYYWGPSIGDGNHDRVEFHGVETFDITTGSGDDRIQTGDNDDRVRTGLGNDHIISGTGTDIIDGGGGNDRWEANKAEATADQALIINLRLPVSQSSYFGTGSVKGIEMLTLVTGAGNDVLTTLDARFDDVLTTNLGADTAIFAGGRDFVDMGGEPEGGQDLLVIDWSDLDYGQTTSFGGTLADGYEGNYYWGPSIGDGNHDRVEFHGVEKFDITTGSGGDYIQTGDADDIVRSGAGNDHIVSGTGTDIIDGGVGDDRWEANKSEATAAQALIVNLRDPVTQSSYFGTGSVSGIEMLTLRTGAGDDRITTIDARFDDVLVTNLGSDTVTFAGGRDYVDMGGQQEGGADTLIIDWSDLDYDQTTSFGGAFATGYEGNYYWGPSIGDGNHDRVEFHGVEKFDITMGSGNDDVRTGDHDDTARGGAGNDILRTGMGADIVVGGNQADGSRGFDRWVADKSAATGAMVINLVTGALANYVIDGRTGSVSGIEAFGLDAGSERFSTGSGADVLTTMAAFYNDFVATNAGNDRVVFAGGRDWADLGAGTDTLVIDWSTIDYGQTTSFGGTLAGGYEGVYFWGPSIGDGNHNLVEFHGVEKFDIVMGSGGDDIRTGDGADRVRGGAGNDHIVTAAGADIVDGGLGDDRWEADKSAATATQALIVNLASNSLQSTYLGTGTVRGIEMLTLTTGAGNDVITTRNARFDDVVTTNAGADKVTFSGGRDIANLGAGVDTLVVDWSDLDYGQTTSISGSLATGYDGVFFWGPSIGDGNHDYAEFHGVEKFDIRMGSGGDFVRTGDGADSVRGGAGNDHINSAAGVDAIDGGTGDDRWEADKSAASSGQAIVVNLAAPGIQSTYFGSGTVRGIEMLTLTTGAGADRITTLGGFFADVLVTNGGADTVLLAGGRDFVDMGAGADTLIVDWSALDYGQTTSISGSLAAGYDGAFFWGPSIGDGNHAIADFRGVEMFDLRMGSAGDFVVTGDGADIVRGGGGGDYMNGAGGVDTADFGDKAGAVSIVLAGAAEAGVFVDGVREDTILNFENLIGGAGDDSLTGDGLANSLAGGAGDDLLDGGAGRDRLDGGFGRDTASYASAASGVTVNLGLATAQNTGGSSIDTLVSIENLIGSRFRDTLTGTAAANVLDGGVGADSMTGGAGNDTYVVDNASDTAIESSATGGLDTVQSSASFTLGANVEALVLTGTAAASGTGNALANTITGNGAANRIDGKAGADRMTGGGGNDSYVVDNANDKVIEAAGGGVDSVTSTVTFALAANVENLTLAGTGAINGTGNGLANRLTGNGAANRLSGGAGNDIISGGAGADVMIGGTGNDTYTVDNAADRVSEALNAGLDVVRSSVSFILVANVEQIVLTGTAAINATGNSLANRLTGNAAANVLNGGIGADAMIGGGGNDTYVVDNAGDTIAEAANRGIDLVRSSVSHTLGANVENLILTGAGAIGGTGNGLANSITGNDAANMLNGGAGNDRLAGGLGADRFVFDTALNATANVDRILDFSSVDDTILLDRAVFDGIAANGRLAASAFHSGTAAHDVDDRIIYDAATGNLFYDADGNGAIQAVLFARLDPGLALTNADFSAFLG